MLVVVYSFLTLNQGPEIIEKGWKSAGIKETLWKVSVGPNELTHLIVLILNQLEQLTSTCKKSRYDM